MPDTADPGFVGETQPRVRLAPPGSISPRKRAMAAFLDECGWGGLVPVPLAADASFRSYYRLSRDGRRAVLMDAPPPQETVAPYIADAPTLYALAVDTLVALQLAVATHGPPDLPPYDLESLLAEAALLVDWYAPAALGLPFSGALREEYFAIWRAVLPQAALSCETLVLRDYHVDNLMLLPDRSGVRGCGLLDFQDAVCGPPSYDLVSLLEDARRDVPAELRRSLTEGYIAAFP